MSTVEARPRRYFRIQFLLFRYLGLGWWHHPDEGNTSNFPGLYIYYTIITELLWVAGFVGLETIDPFIGEKDVDRFMFSLSFVVTHDLTIIKLYIFFFKNKEIQEIVHTLEIGLYNFYQNNKRNRATFKLSRIMTGSFIFFGWITIMNTNIYGIVQDYRWKKEIATLNKSSPMPARTLPQPIYIPWPYQSEGSYVFTFALETIGILWTGHIVMGIDTFIGSIILHMGNQFVNLQEAIRTGYDRAMLQLYERIDTSDRIDDTKTIERIVRAHYPQNDIDACVEDVVRKCILQYQVLLDCIQKFNDTYTYGFMTQLLSSVAAICSVMVQLSQDASSFKSIRIVTSLAFFFAMIIQLAIQCFTGNELTYQAAQVSDVLMQCKWERMPVRVRRLLMLTMLRAQRPVRLTAAGFANMDNACFLSIMKAAYSYYAVLSQRQA